MIGEILSTVAEVSAKEVASSAAESVLKFDSSKAIDFSNDSKNTSFTADNVGDKEVEGEIAENSIGNSNELDTSKALDFSNSDSIDEKESHEFDSKEESLKIEKDSIEGKTGGSYNELKAEGHGWNHIPPEEVHHTPAWEAMGSATKVEYGDCPAIAMEKNDHKQTASYGFSNDAREYRAEQSRLIKEGKFEDAVQMDIDDIQEKFGDKYNDAINQMKEYVQELKENNYV